MSSNLTSSATSPLISFPLKLERCTIAFMKLLISIYFYILATIQFGLLLGVYHYYRSQHTIRPSLYWMSSLVVSIVGLITFGTGIVTLTDIAHPEFNFTVANTLFFIAATLQFLFCRSLVHPIGRRLQAFFIVLTKLNIIDFERVAGGAMARICSSVRGDVGRVVVWEKKFKQRNLLTKQYGEVSL